MTQNNTTATIEQFLKSRYRNPITGQLDGLAVDENGDFLHYNVIIDQTFNELFKDMRLNQYVDDDFKKLFCQRFYNREIGFETFARFQVFLEQELNTDCLNLFKVRDTLKNMSLDQMNQDTNMYNDGSSKNDSHTLSISNTTPQEHLSITYDNDHDQKYGAIDYANALGEGNAKGKEDHHSYTHGWAGGQLAQRYNQLAQMEDLTFEIFNILEPLFLQVW